MSDRRTGLPKNVRIRDGSICEAMSLQKQASSLNLIGFSAAVVEHGGMDIEIPAQPEHRLSIALGVRPKVTTDISGKNLTETLDDFAVNTVPADMKTTAHDPTPGRFLHIRYNPMKAAAWTDTKAEMLEPRPGSNQRDPELRRMAKILLREMSCEEQPSVAMMVEGIALQLIAHIVRAYHNPNCGRLQQGGLAPWQVQRAVDYLREKLAEDIGLEELATLVDLSRFHFARSFQRSTGLAPHQYLTKLRLDRAAELLAASDLSIQTIAEQVGYKGAKTLQRPFKRRFRVTPAGYRRICRL